MILLALSIAASSFPHRGILLPSSEGAVLAAVETCLKATGPFAAAAEVGLRDWKPAPAGSFVTSGRAVQRDNVIMAITPGGRGACMIVARGNKDFSGSHLRHDLESRFGAQLRSETPPVLRMPDGRLIRLNVGAKDVGPTYVQLAVASPKGKSK